VCSKTIRVYIHRRRACGKKVEGETTMVFSYSQTALLHFRNGESFLFMSRVAPITGEDLHRLKHVGSYTCVHFLAIKRCKNWDHIL